MGCTRRWPRRHRAQRAIDRGSTARAARSAHQQIDVVSVDNGGDHGTRWHATLPGRRRILPESRNATQREQRVAAEERGVRSAERSHATAASAAAAWAASASVRRCSRSARCEARTGVNARERSSSSKPQSKRRARNHISFHVNDGSNSAMSQTAAAPARQSQTAPARPRARRPPQAVDGLLGGRVALGRRFVNMIFLNSSTAVAVFAANASVLNDRDSRAARSECGPHAARRARVRARAAPHAAHAADLVGRRRVHRLDGGRELAPVDLSRRCR